MYRSLSIALSAVIILSAGSIAHAQALTCPSGTAHLATEAEAASASDGSIVAGKTYVCPGDARLGISNDVGAAKQVLEQMTCGSSVNIAQLDPKFTVCAARFMKALRAISPSSCITSAYRDQKQQAAACMNICGQLSCPGTCAAPGKSYHQRGLAIDIAGKLSVPHSQFWQLASLSGLGNPKSLHNSDPNHIQSMNGGINCASIGYQPTEGDIFIPGPASANPYFNYAPYPLPSMLPLSMSPSTLTLPSSPTPTQTAPAQTTPSQTQTPPKICAPQFSCTDGTMYYHTTSCNTQVYQVCAYGCNGNSCAAATSSSQGGLSGAFSSSTEDDSGDAASEDTQEEHSPISDLLSQITGFSFSAVDLATSSSIAFSLDPRTGEVGSITDPLQHNDIASGVIESVQPTGAQTFTSGDLAQFSAPPQASQTMVTPLQGILQGMKAALDWALGVLKSL